MKFGTVKVGVNKVHEAMSQMDDGTYVDLATVQGVGYTWRMWAEWKGWEATSREDGHNKGYVFTAIILADGPAPKKGHQYDGYAVEVDAVDYERGWREIMRHIVEDVATAIHENQ